MARAKWIELPARLRRLVIERMPKSTHGDDCTDCREFDQAVAIAAMTLMRAAARPKRKARRK